MGPRLFILYSADLADVTVKHGVTLHAFANDTQLYSLQFLFKSTHNSWRYDRKCEWVFFSEHSVDKAKQILKNSTQ